MREVLSRMAGKTSTRQTEVLNGPPSVNGITLRRQRGHLRLHSGTPFPWRMGKRERQGGVDRGVGGVDWQLEGRSALLAVVLRIFPYPDQANAQAAMRQWTRHV